MKRLLMAWAAAAAIVGCKAVSASSDEPAASVVGDRLTLAPNSDQLKGVTSATVAGDGVDSLDVPGRVVWNEDATVRIFAPFAGRVTAVIVDVGRSVKAGDTLALVASPDFGQAQADARRAGTDLALARRAAARAHDLQAHGVIAIREVESADADLARARTEYDRARARVALYGADTTTVDQVYALRAPIGGTVVDRSISPGQEVRPDQMLANTPQLVAPLFVVSDPSRLWVTLDLPERDAPLVRSGTTVRFRSDAVPGDTFTGTIQWVANAVDPSSRMVKARAATVNHGGALRAEMLVTMRAPRPAEGGPSVPAIAVAFKDGGHIVFVDEGAGQFVRREVSIGPEHGDRVTILRGLRPGERVVNAGVLLLEQLYESARKS